MLKKTLILPLILLLLSGCAQAAQAPAASAAMPTPTAVPVQSTAPEPTIEPAVDIAACFDDLAGVDADTLQALYAHYRHSVYTPEYFDAWCDKGVKVGIHAQRPFQEGLLLLAYMHRDGEIGPELLYVRDGAVRYTTPSTDVWSVSYTRLLGHTLAFANTFAWDGHGYMPSTHVEAAFTDGQRDEVAMPMAAGDPPRGFIAVAAGETWLASLRIFDGEQSIADASELAFSNVQPWWDGDLRVRNYTRFEPMLPPGVWQAVQAEPQRPYLRLGDGPVEDWPNESGVRPENIRALLRWDKRAEMAFPDLWRNWNNYDYSMGYDGVRADTPLYPMELPAEVQRACWVALSADDGSQAGLDAAVTELSPTAGVWGAVSQPGVYLFVLETADAYYTVAMEVVK